MQQKDQRTIDKIRMFEVLCNKAFLFSVLLFGFKLLFFYILSLYFFYYFPVLLCVMSHVKREE